VEQSTYFFSDVHLGLGSNGEEKQKENRLIAFLRSVKPSAAALYILGDLFDFWFEYKTVIPRGFHRTLSAVQEYTDGGIPVHYLAGNHDFWMDNYFRDELGVVMHRDPFETEIDGKRLHHGDGLAGKDTGYRMIKPILRSRLSIRLYRWIHPDIGVRFARGSSRASRRYTTTKDYGEEDSMRQYAADRLKEGVDIVVMGHRHAAAFEQIGNGVYVNLGDWITANTYAVMQNGKIALATWNGGPRERG
jgi:UDP-2,3-diacylglucosamine hydrolase